MVFPMMTFQAVSTEKLMMQIRYFLNVDTILTCRYDIFRMQIRYFLNVDTILTQIRYFQNADTIFSKCRYDINTQIRLLQNIVSANFEGIVKKEVHQSIQLEILVKKKMQIRYFADTIV